MNPAKPVCGPQPQPVQVTIPVTFSVDAGAYAAEYGDTLPGTPESFAADELHELLDGTFPTHLRRILGTPHIGQPLLSSTARYAALEGDILTATVEFLARLLDGDEQQAATGVVFAAAEYDDGWFVVAHCATVYFAGQRAPRSTDFAAVAYTEAGSLDRLLTDYTGGARGPQSAVSVDLASGEVQFDAAGEHEFRRRFALASKPTVMRENR